MENKTYRVFDAEQLYETEIVPVVNQLNSLLLHYNIPYFFAAAIRSDETGTDYRYECHDIWSSTQPMKEDKIPAFIMVANGIKKVVLENS